MCGQWKSKTDSELSTEEWFGVLSQLKGSGIKDVSIAGGEPFIRRDLMDIINYANNIGLQVGIITNGYLLDKKIIAEAVKAGVKSFSISMDAVGDNFDNIRGRKGAYQKVLESCRILSEHKNDGIYVDLYYTLMKTTIDSYKEVFAIAENFNFPFVVNLFDYTPYFFKDLNKTKEFYWLDKEARPRLKEFQRFVVKKKQNNAISVYHTYSEINYFEKYFRDPLQKSIPCTVSQKRIGIDSQGNVFGGCWSMGSFGSLKEKSLKNILNSDKYKKTHKKMFLKICPGCSCGYSANLRYFLPVALKELIFKSVPPLRRKVYA